MKNLLIILALLFTASSSAALRSMNEASVKNHEVITDTADGGTFYYKGKKSTKYSCQILKLQTDVDGELISRYSILLRGKEGKLWHSLLTTYNKERDNFYARNVLFHGYKNKFKRKGNTISYSKGSRSSEGYFKVAIESDGQFENIKSVVLQSGPQTFFGKVFQDVMSGILFYEGSRNNVKCLFK